METGRRIRKTDIDKRGFDGKMKESKYDEPVFFTKYGEMERSKRGLEGAGEWQELKRCV